MGAFRLIEMVGRMRAIMPVSRGGTEWARLMTARETHLLFAEGSCNAAGFEACAYKKLKVGALRT